MVRISGPKAQQAIEKMTKIQKLEPRKTFLKKIYYPDTNEVIDKGLCIWFPGTLLILQITEKKTKLF